MKRSRFIAERSADAMVEDELLEGARTYSTTTGKALTAIACAPRDSTPEI